MKLRNYLALPDNAHSQQGNPGVKVNALYKSEKSINCYLTPTQAMELSEALLTKARLILEEGVDDAAVQLWSEGEDYEKFSVGLVEARKGPRRKKAKKAAKKEQ